MQVAHQGQKNKFDYSKLLLNHSCWYKSVRILFFFFLQNQIAPHMEIIFLIFKYFKYTFETTKVQLRVLDISVLYNRK